MLNLEAVDISGFKSFVDPVDLTFSGRISAIVGPNGCGKSNVADAITWVLGERSAKALRADTMDDVIFAGAAGRKPLGMAEVTLSLRTDDAFPHSEEGRLTIGRRVFRSGESTFLINGKSARLKDIKDLLSGTGLGLRAYSVIEQGRIDLILSGKPQERRKLLEEAAGVTKYRNRRHLTQLKLEEATDNLNRLNDIVSEVERQIRSLKRQAGAARRYTQRRSDFRELLQATLVARATTLRTELADIDSALATAEDSTSELAGRLTEREAEAAALRQASDKQGELVSEHHRKEAELAAAIQGRQEFLEGTRRTLTEIDERVESNKLLLTSTSTEVEDMDRRLKDLESIRNETTAAYAAAEQDLSSHDNQFTGAEQLVSQEKAALEEVRTALLEAFGSLSGERNRLHQQTTEKEKGQFRLRRIAEERERKTELLGTTEAELKQLAETAAEARQNEQDLRGKIDTLVTQRVQLESRSEELRQQRNAREQEVSRRSAALAFLVEAGQEQAGRRARLEKRLQEAGISHPAFLADRIEARRGWERAIDFFLNHLTGALLAEDGHEDDLAAVLGSGEGSSTVVIGKPTTAVHADDEPGGDPAVVASLGESLGLDEDLAAAMPQAWLVKTWADARRLAEEYPDSAFLCQDGRWLQGRVLRVLGEKAQPGTIARDNERRKLEEELPRLQVEVEDLDRDLEALEAKLAANNHHLEQLRSELGQAQRQAAVAATREEEAVATRTRLTSELRGLENETIEVEREIERLDESIKEHRLRVADLEQRHAEQEKAFDTQQNNLEQARERREQSRASGASRRGAFEVIAERVGANQREMTRLQQDRTVAAERIKSWELEIERLGKRRQDLEREMAEVSGKLQRALEAKAELEQAGVGLRQQWEDARQKLTEVEQSLTVDRSSLEGQRASSTDLKVTRAGLHERLEHVGSEYHEHFNAGLPEPAEVDERPLDELERRLEAARGVLDRMGPVNELAAEELEEHEQRHEFLTSQRADVIESVDSLRVTIAEIDATSSERFLATFEAVNQHFGSAFTELFGGGEAEMRLMDEDDVLESGIEIVARPPGKRLQNLMLLSGGEKALTALALLFALFRHMPSPFCVLDEVDAPLDDLNCLRFVEMLRRMAQETQFIVITHNKLTMEVASTLYGVTMAERGVSKVVSVELDEIDEQIHTAVSA